MLSLVGAEDIILLLEMEDLGLSRPHTFFNNFLIYFKLSRVI